MDPITITGEAAISAWLQLRLSELDTKGIGDPRLSVSTPCSVPVSMFGYRVGKGYEFISGHGTTIAEAYNNLRKECLTGPQRAKKLRAEAAAKIAEAEKLEGGATPIADMDLPGPEVEFDHCPSATKDR